MWNTDSGIGRNDVMDVRDVPVKTPHVGFGCVMSLTKLAVLFSFKVQSIASYL